MDNKSSTWDREKVSFKALQLEDLPLMYRWVNTPHVMRWWDRRAMSQKEVDEEYTPYITGQQPTRAFLIQYEGRPIGYIQSYRIDDYPDYSKYLELGFEAISVDLFIGEVNYLHKGLGSIILEKYVQEVVFADEDIETCIIGPDATNTSAIRAYKKAGFKYLKTAQVADEENPEYLMVVSRHGK